MPAVQPQTIESLFPARVSEGTRKRVWDYWPAGLLALVILVLYAPVLGRLIHQWYSDPNYSHGFFVPLFSGFLVWRKRGDLAPSAAAPSLGGLVVILGSLAVLFIGSLGSELFLQRISLLGVIAGLIIYFFGWRLLRQTAFPLAFLTFMIPLPAVIYNQIVFPLQLLASRFATTCLETINLFPVLREGNLLMLDNYSLEVVDACSGIRSLTSLIALALGYSYLVDRRWSVRLFLTAAMIPVAIISNGVRVVITAMLVNYFGINAAEGFVHSFAGWVIFMISLIMLFLLHGLVTITDRWRGAIAV
ncbi:MAG TPA: exosortase/archaeosortase family protein [Terriglobales bacterium]